MRSQVFISYLARHLCFLRITRYLLRLCEYKCGNHGDLATSPTATCGPPAPVLDHPPPSTHLGQCRMCLVSHRSRGKCLISHLSPRQFLKKILNNKPGRPGQTLGHWRKRGAMREVWRNIRGTAWQERGSMMREAAVQQERWRWSKRGSNSTTSRHEKDVGATRDKVVQQPASTREVQWVIREGGVTMINALVRADWGLVWYVQSKV